MGTAKTPWTDAENERLKALVVPRSVDRPGCSCVQSQNGSRPHSRPKTRNAVPANERVSQEGRGRSLKFFAAALTLVSAIA
jgi:hypothetical protein